MTEKLRLGATPFPFKPSGGASLACTGSTGSVALAGTGEQVLVTNAGSAAVYIEMGASAVTATTAGLPVLPGTQVLLTIPESSAGTRATHLAGITDGNSVTIKAYTGWGL